MSTTTSTPGSVLLAPSKYNWAKYDLMYYLKGAASGGICCSITHAALTPVDVVKTRVQLDPTKVCLAISCKNDPIYLVRRITGRKDIPFDKELLRFRQQQSNG